MSTLENLVTSLQNDWKSFSTDFSVVWRHLVLGAGKNILDLLGIEPDLTPEQEAEKERLRLKEVYEIPSCPVPEPPTVPSIPGIPEGVKQPEIQVSGVYAPKPQEMKIGIDGKLYGHTKSFGLGGQ